MVGRNVAKIQKLAEALTSFARPSDGARDLVDPVRALEESVLLSEHEFRTRQVEVERDFAPEVPAVWANEGQLHHVFLNLLRNAAQAVETRVRQDADNGGITWEPGRVTLRARRDEGGFVSIDVSDNGCGIHPDYQERLFTPFFTTKPRGQGTGLGLYIVKQIVDDLGGRIDVQSAVHRGTTFRILLPRDAKSARPG